MASFGWTKTGVVRVSECPREDEDVWVVSFSDLIDFKIKSYVII